MEGDAIRHNFGRGPPKDHPSQLWFNCIQWFQWRRFECESLQPMTSDGKSSRELEKQTYKKWQKFT